MRSPLVSYCISASHQRYIDQAVNSALSQNVSDIEILISDIGDLRGDPVFRGYDSDARIRKIKREGTTATKSLNEMIRQAQSEIIVYLGDDDVDLPNKVEVMLEGLKECDIFRGSYNEMDKDGNIGDPVMVPEYNFENHMYNGLNINIGCSAFWKERCPLLNEELEYLSDYAWWFECFRSGLKMGRTDTVVSNIRKWDGQMSSAPAGARLLEHEIFMKTYGVRLNR